MGYNSSLYDYPSTVVDTVISWAMEVQRILRRDGFKATGFVVPQEVADRMELEFAERHLCILPLPGRDLLLFGLPMLIGQDFQVRHVST